MLLDNAGHRISGYNVKLCKLLPSHLGGYSLNQIRRSSGMILRPPECGLARVGGHSTSNSRYNGNGYETLIKMFHSFLDRIINIIMDRC